MRLVSRFALSFVAALLLGCGRASAPTQPEPPPGPNPGNALFACGAWSPARPTVEVAVFDLNPIGSAYLDAIRDAGGEVLHEFHVRLVRARLPVSAVPRLYQDAQVWFAREVADGQGLGFDGFIGIPTPLSAGDRDFLDSAGVAVLQEYVSIDAIHAMIPDPVVPTIQAHPGVWGLDINNVACVDGAVAAAAHSIRRP